MDIYYNIIQKIKIHFPTTWKEKFLQGGCFWLADYIHKNIPESIIMVNWQAMHAAIQINQKLYDITGNISKNNFHHASPQDINYMKKHFIPNFDTTKLKEFIEKST